MATSCFLNDREDLVEEDFEEDEPDEDEDDDFEDEEDDEGGRPEWVVPSVIDPFFSFISIFANSSARRRALRAASTKGLLGGGPLGASKRSVEPSESPSLSCFSLG